MQYYCILLILCLVAVFSKNITIKNLISWITLALMFILTVFRADHIGYDTENYLYNFTVETRVSEWLTTLMYLWANYFAVDKRVILVIYGVITYICIPKISQKYNIQMPYILLFYLLGGYFIMGLNIMRQIASVSLIILAIPYIYSPSFRKSLLYFLIIIVAAGLHISSIVFLALYCLRFINISKKNAIIITSLISPLIVLNIIPIDNIIKNFIPENYESYSSIVDRTLAVSSLGYIANLIYLILKIYLLRYIEDKFNLLYAISIILTSSFLGMDSNVARIFLSLSLFINYNA